MGPIRKATHIFAAALVLASAFAVSPAGQALIHQYPVLSGVAAAIAALVAVYHNPQQ